MVNTVQVPILTDMIGILQGKVIKLTGPILAKITVLHKRNFGDS